ncbi:TetR/AcrR family transcriptional regulator [Nocardioides conyzicola]|uniref:TetR/AcrR family transcriptional regulator n=1 Tax=Nocardioides conyzicola TaxID=1651781 RepID=A0ABP8XI15_9ACTN
MSEEPSPTDVRRRLIEVAADVLSEEGPGALSARRLARDAATSTMAVYTHFGGMPGLVRAVVTEGFARLYDRVAEVEPTDDPLADLVASGIAYRAHALADPHLYLVMFGSASLGRYRLTEAELEIGLAAFNQLVAAVQRVMDAGVIRSDDPGAVAGQFWAALHGYVMIELSGLSHVVDDPEGQILQPLLGNLLKALA